MWWDLALLGNEETQPAGQFERAFKSAEKHEVARVVQTNGAGGADGLTVTLDTLHPNRLVDGWESMVLAGVARANV